MDIKVHAADQISVDFLQLLRFSENYDFWGAAQYLSTSYPVVNRQPGSRRGGLQMTRFESLDEAANAQTSPLCCGTV